MNDYNELVLEKRHFGDKIWTYIGFIMKVLIMAEYECEIFEEEDEIYVIRYNWNRNLGYGNATLAWVDNSVRELVKLLNSQELDDEDEISIEKLADDDPFPVPVEEYPEGFEPDRNPEPENFSVQPEPECEACKINIVEEEDGE